ncbi:MAG: MATE family efflux transporter, partial [Prevotellaceae bacterium]|nr:MATE family efflux transporter [Prevotellaceae bacterium]
NHSELKSLLHKSIVIIGISGIILTVVSELFAPLIASIFVSYDESLMQLSVHAIRVHMLCFLVCGFSIFTSAWFTALNNGMVSAAVAFSRTLIFELGSVIILPAFFGIDGIWMSVNVSEVLALVLSAAVIYAYRKRYCYA